MTSNVHPVPKATAVVVNDDLIQLQALAGLLTKEGIEVQTFERAETALKAMSRSHPPDLIVTDLYMPGIDGWRFCRLLRSPDYAPLNRVPILVVSATFAGEEATRIAADLGANVFLASPADSRKFVEQVQMLLRGEHPQKFLRVLIVEDNESQAEVLQVAFEAHGYHVDVARTGREAEAKFQAGAYEVVILDHHLPDTQGDKLLVTFRQQRPDIVYLAMTGDAHPELALAWMNLGAAAFVSKPFSPPYLIELCAKARRERDLLRIEDRLEARTRELRQSEERFTAFMSHLPAAAFVKDQAGRTLFANQYLQNLLSFADWEGKTTPELVAGETGQQMVLAAA
jgi:two-component system, cell cycle sensor histidine kinase and response regulator CckA